MTAKNSGKIWAGKEIEKLEKLADKNTPTRLIAWELKRSEDAIRAKAQEEKISLKPVNQSPYSRRKK